MEHSEFCCSRYEMLKICIQKTAAGYTERRSANDKCQYFKNNKVEKQPVNKSRQGGRMKLQQ